MISISIISFSLLAYVSVKSAEQPQMQRAPQKVECNDEIKLCTYVVQNLTGRELVAKINAIVFPGSILSSSEGVINVKSLKEITFYINDPELRSRFIAIIPLLDVFDDFAPSSLVQLTTEIYSLSEGGLTELQAEVTAATTNPASDIADVAIKTMTGGAVDLGLRIGTNFLSSVLGSRKVKERSSKITTVTQLIPNFASINYSHNTNIYVSPTAGVVKDEMSGININGSVSISGSDSDLVLIKDYSFKYGVVESGATPTSDRVNMLSFSNPQLYLVRGISSLLISSVTRTTTDKTETGILSWGKTKNELQSKIMVITRAEAISFQSFITDLKKIRTLELHREFTQIEKDSFPNNELEMTEVLNHVKPYAMFSPSGDRILGFRLDFKDARISNIAKNIEISIKSGSLFKAGGLKQKRILSVENLMLSGIKFDDTLTSKELNQAKVKITIELKLFNSNDKTTTTLFYNPETNKFIE